jgi:hypothetical protein
MSTSSVRIPTPKGLLRKEERRSKLQDKIDRMATQNDIKMTTFTHLQVKLALLEEEIAHYQKCIAAIPGKKRTRKRKSLLSRTDFKRVNLKVRKCKD